MNENVQKSLVMGASIMVTIGVISIGLMIFGQGTGLVKESSKNLVDITQELANKKYIAYDDTVVSGSEVINAIGLYTQKGQSIEVTTTMGNSVVYTSNNLYSNDNVTSGNYINVGGMFKSSITKNANGVITKISFSQVG